jgi:thiamine biosynthesis lipoprotein
MRCATLLLAGWLLAAAAFASDGSLVRETREAMGSAVTISVWTTDPTAARAAMEKAFAAIATVDRLFSPRVPDSVVSRVNASAARAEVTIPPEALPLFELALEACRLSDGAFDISFQGLGLWRFGLGEHRVPTNEEVARSLPLVDCRNVRLDPARRTVRLAKEGMAVGFGGIGQGYAADLAADALVAGGARDFLVDVSGDTRVSGTKGGVPWRIGIQDPRGPRGTTVAEVTGWTGALVTSGDYEKFFVEDGKRYHHILDPKTGFPAAECGSVTVFAPRAATADWLATAICVLGPDKGIALAEHLGVHALVYPPGGGPRVTRDFAKAVAIRFR